MDMFWIYPEPVRERSQDTDFVEGVVAVDVQRRFGLGVTLALGFLEHRIEFGALAFHAREDVIAGAVDDAVKVRYAIPDKPSPQRFDDGNAAAHAGLVIKIGTVILGRFKQLFAMRGEQGLVCRDDGFAKLEGGEHDRARDGRAPD